MSNVLRDKFAIKLITMLFTLAYMAVYSSPVYAADLTDASTTLSDPRTSTSSTYTFNVSGASTGTTVRCVQVQFNDQADGGGSVPSNMDSTTAAVTAGGTLLVGEEGWTEDHSTNGTLEISDATGATPAANGTLVFNTITNGDTESTTYYALFNTYSDQGCVTGVDSIVMAFNFKDGELVTLTIDPSLTFSCTGVAAATDIYPVGGASLNTTVLSDASGINHGNSVTTSQNGISAHDLTTATNATGGLNVYIRHSGQLTNAASDVIDEGSLSSSAFPAAGTDEAWAWTTDDDDVGTYNNAGTGLWESFNTTNATVVSTANAPQASTVNRVGHQVGIQGDTPAGTYTTTIIYTAVAVY